MTYRFNDNMKETIKGLFDTIGVAIEEEHYDRQLTITPALARCPTCASNLVCWLTGVPDPDGPDVGIIVECRASSGKGTHPPDAAAMLPVQSWLRALVSTLLAAKREGESFEDVWRLIREHEAGRADAWARTTEGTPKGEG